MVILCERLGRRRSNTVEGAIDTASVASQDLFLISPDQKSVGVYLWNRCNYISFVLVS
jgi:hypothetical protein